MPEDARKTALLILNTLDKKQQTLDSILNHVLAKPIRLSRRDRGLLYALVYGVLRWRGRLDWIIEHFSKTRLKKINPNVLNILRLGLFQIIYLTRIPSSAAVNTSVEMTKSVAAPYVVRYVNGLLRNAAKKYQQVPFPDSSKDPALALATDKSFPDWLIKRWLQRFGFQETEQLCDAVNAIPPITVRTNTLKLSRNALMASLKDAADNLSPTTYAPGGISFFNPKDPVFEMDTFQKGLFQVQDEAAQLVTLLLNPQPGETVLDACAGLGGKTGHITQLMQNSGNLIAMDHDHQKLLRLTSAMNRIGASIVTTLAYDLNHPLDLKQLDMFDRILLDAPCSGLGVLRRNPDAKWTPSKQNLIEFQKRQVRFLNNLAPFVKPHGTVVYTVCSFEPEENEAVVKLFLNKHSDFAIERNTAGMVPDVCSLVDANRYFRTYPHLHNMDGFFAVRLKRIR